MGVLHQAKIEDVVVRRMLSVIINPNRYQSKAAEAFIRDILPLFSTHDFNFSPKESVSTE
jgi:hypothetical protein